MLIDLQLHSTYSDGYLSPTEVAQFISKLGIKIASLTDHNTISGQDEFRCACQKYNIKVITGLELYVKLNNKKLNILWYNFDDTDPELHKILRDSQRRRRGRVRAILEQLALHGFKIEVDKIIDKYNHYVPINHIVDDIMSNPFNRSKITKETGNKNPREDEIIRKLFHNNKYGHLHESYINIFRILKLRKKIGGQLILNHPAKYGYVQKDFLKKIKKLGLDGIEVLSPHHSVGAVMYLQFCARELDFVTTGGSDFHRFEGQRAPIQNSWQYFKIDSKYLRKINKIINKTEI